MTAGTAIAVAAGGLAAALWLGDASVPSAALLGRHGYFGAFLLLYLEESGLPLLVPGAAFALYVGHRLPNTLLPWVGAWLGIIGAVTLGATNLYFLSRALGGRLIEHPIGRFLHLSNARLDVAEHSFRRWGTFAPFVAVSTAVWAGLFMGLGATFGEEARQLLAVPFVQVLLVSVLAVALGSLVLLKLSGVPATRRSMAVVAFASVQGVLLSRGAGADRVRRGPAGRLWPRGKHRSHGGHRDFRRLGGRGCRPRRCGQRLESESRDSQGGLP